MIIKQGQLKYMSNLYDIASDAYIVFDWLCYINVNCELIGFNGATRYGNRKFSSIEAGLEYLINNYNIAQKIGDISPDMKNSMACDVLWSSEVCRSKYISSL